MLNESSHTLKWNYNSCFGDLKWVSFNSYWFRNNALVLRSSLWPSYINQKTNGRGLIIITSSSLLHNGLNNLLQHATTSWITCGWVPFDFHWRFKRKENFVKVKSIGRSVDVCARACVLFHPKNFKLRIYSCSAAWTNSLTRNF